MKNDYNRLVEQSEMNQSIDENFNTNQLRDLYYSIAVHYHMVG
jgi:hypothetical protein